MYVFVVGSTLSTCLSHVLKCQETALFFYNCRWFSKQLCFSFLGILLMSDCSQSKKTKHSWLTHCKRKIRLKLSTRITHKLPQIAGVCLNLWLLMRPDPYSTWKAPHYVTNLTKNPTHPRKIRSKYYISNGWKAHIHLSKTFL